MNTNGEKGSAEEAAPDAGVRRRTPWPLWVVAGLLVAVPFAYWYGTWFGRGLSDEQLEKYLDEGDNPRHVQHALSQIADRLERDAADAGRWLPRVVEAAASPHPDVRMTAAWVMGLEHRREDFREALLRLVGDPEPIVRRNAALALVRFGDARARPELRAMLRPYVVGAPARGTALTALSEGTVVERGTLMVRLAGEGGRVEDVRSPLPGKILRAAVREGQVVEAGEELFVLAPDAEHVGQAIIALYYLGEAEDLPELERYAAGAEGMPEGVKKQAALAAEAVRRRASAGS